MKKYRIFGAMVPHITTSNIDPMLFSNVNGRMHGEVAKRIGSIPGNINQEHLIK